MIQRRYEETRYLPETKLVIDPEVGSDRRQGYNVGSSSPLSCLPFHFEIS